MVKSIWRCLSESEDGFEPDQDCCHPGCQGLHSPDLGLRLNCCGNSHAIHRLLIFLPSCHACPPSTRITSAFLVFTLMYPPGPPRTRIAFAEKVAHGLLISAGVLAGWIFSIKPWALKSYLPDVTQLSLTQLSSWRAHVDSRPYQGLQSKGLVWKNIASVEPNNKVIPVEKTPLCFVFAILHSMNEIISKKVDGSWNW